MPIDKLKARQKRTMQIARKGERLRKARLQQAEQAAAIVDEVLDVRVRLWPPEALTDAASVDHRSDEAGFLVAPHWNGAVRMLGHDGSGYEALLRMRGRLKDQIDEFEQQLKGARRELRAAHGVLGFLKAEAVKQGWTPDALPDTAHYESAGRGKLLKDSPGWPRPPAQNHGTHSGWKWGAIAGNGQIPDRYILHAEGEEEWMNDVLHAHHRSFRATSSWADAVTQASDSADAVEAETAMLQGQLSVAWFRFDVVEQVLREFELLGHVGDFEAAGQFLRPLSKEAAEFVVTAKELVDELPDYYTSRTKVLSAVGEERGLSERRARRLAKSIGAYRSGSGGGKGTATAQDHVAEFTHFMRVVARHCERDPTVKDVLISRKNQK